MLNCYESEICSFGQDLKDYENIYEYYNNLTSDAKDLFTNHLIEFILQLKCEYSDIGNAVRDSNLNPKSNCCILLYKGIYYHNLRRVYSVDHPTKSIKLLLHLFKISYKKKRANDNRSFKWWNLTTK